MDKIRELHIADVAAEWASGEPISKACRLQIALLRMAGCQCEFPLIRSAQSSSRPDIDEAGVRCKFCNTHVLLTAPTPEMKLARAHHSHRLARQMILRWQRENRDVAAAFWLDLTICKEEYGCKPGCGCELDNEDDASASVQRTSPEETN